MEDFIKQTVETISVALNSCMKQMQEKVDKLTKENKMLREDLDSANNALEDDQPDEVSLVHEIDCGIGKIEYNTDNLLLEQLMEALAEKIKGSNAAAVLAAINNI